MADNNQKSAINSLLNELKAVKSNVTLGGLSFKELTYEQRRKIISGNASVPDVIANTQNVLNEYIKQNVEFVDDVVKSDTLTADVRPFVLNVLRSISIGKEIKLDEKNYKLYEVQPEDLVSKLQPEVYKRDTFELVISVPTIKEDTIYNALLVNALSQFRSKQLRTMTDMDVTTISELYSFYENMKYIKSFTIDGSTYSFIELATGDKVALLNQFPQQIINVLRKYRKQVDECYKKAFTVTSLDDGSTREIEHELELFTSDDQ